jgi:hypothetical protein
MIAVLADRALLILRLVKAASVHEVNGRHYIAFKVAWPPLSDTYVVSSTHSWLYSNMHMA